MKAIAMILVIVVALTGGMPVRADQGAKLVEGVLQPRVMVDEKTVKPKRFPIPQFLENPTVPLSPFAGPLPKTEGKGPSRPVKPRSVPEENPLTSSRSATVLPPVPPLPVGPLVRLQGVDANQVPPLPYLARPIPDRASLADPTVEASTAAILVNSIPVRTSPAPFVRINLPDPFEHHNAIRVRPPIAEGPDPPLMMPRSPGR